MKASILIGLTALFLNACSQDLPEPPEDPVPNLEESTDMTDTPAQLALLTWSDLLSQERPTPTTSLTLGDGETDIVDLWLPETPGPHPVVLMVHGGCWQKSIADRTLMNYAAEDLRQRGLAVWNIEYRGVDEDGGGYPGTYLDVAKAADALRDHAEEYDLDLNRVAGMGHSAGGHLVTWLATRVALPAESPLAVDNPLPLIGVVNSGGLADLEVSVDVTQFECLGAIIDDLTGPSSETRPNVFSDTSPAELLPVEPKFVSVSGAMDGISPPGLAEDIAAKDQAAGGTGRAIIVPGNNHVDLVAPGTAAWEAQAGVLQDMLAPR
jgi:acetyl esterase/lipase